MRGNLRANEEEELNLLLACLRHAHLKLNLKDCRLWKEEDSNHFSCKFFFQVLIYLDQVHSFDTAQAIWESKVLVKIHVFSWLVA